MTRVKILADEKDWKGCPFGIAQRSCLYQGTRARDIVSAMAGDLRFFCKLKYSLRDCPVFRKTIAGGYEKSKIETR